MGTYGEIYIDDGMTTQVTNATPGAYDLVTGFNTAEGFNGLSASATPDKANNQITLTLAGVYAVRFAASLTGKTNTIFTFAAFLDSSRLASCAFARKLGSAGDVGSASFEGYAAVTAGQVLDVRVAADAASADMLLQYANLSAERIG